MTQYQPNDGRNYDQKLVKLIPHHYKWSNFQNQNNDKTYKMQIRFQTKFFRKESLLMNLPSQKHEALTLAWHHSHSQNVCIWTKSFLLTGFLKVQ